MNRYPDFVWTVQTFVPDPDASYSVDSAAHITGVSRHDIVMYCKHGFVTPIVDPNYGSLSFDETALRTLQRIAYLRNECGINYTGVRIILDLMGEVERLRAEVAV